MSSSKRGERVVVSQQSLQKKTYAWHAHDSREVLALLELTVDGLSDREAKERQRKFGKNAFTEIPQEGLLKRIFDQLRSPLAFVLLLAFGVTAALEEYIDAGVILFALLIAVVVGVVQEGRASRAFEKLSKSQVKTATVMRGGKRHEIPAGDVVPGDIVLLQNGNHVPADIRLIHSKNLSINEAPLTGEWMAVEKSIDPVPVGAPLAEQTSMAWKGTFVAEGEGYGVVIHIGDDTAVGKLAKDVQDVVEIETPLQYEMQKLSRIMLYIISVIVFLIFILGIIKGISLHDMLLTAIAVAVAAIPEGLPAAVTIILAVGMESLLTRGGLVRNLLAAETLGSTTYVLTDKTGTLTQARMAVTGLIFSDSEIEASEEWGSNKRVRELLNISLAATDAYVDTGADNVIRGDSVEKAVLYAARFIDIVTDTDSYRSERIDHMAFTSENRFAAGLVASVERRFLCINGAPELLLERATRVMGADGPMPLSTELRKQIEASIEKETAAGKRLVAVGYSEADYSDIPENDSDILFNDFVFAGVLILTDPVRPGVADAILGVKSAGAEVLLITGDNPKTALSIASQVGIADSKSRVMTGNELSDMSDSDILQVLKAVKVFARVLPQQKMRIAMILQQKGEIVAMTGDGINDAPALRRANIGVAIGSGTEVAKEASDLVLVNDSFETIYAAIEEGRRIISNLRKIVGYLLSTSLSEVVLVGAAILVGAPPPLLPAQILWANIIEEGLMSVAFAFEKGERGAMQRRPHDIHEEGILSRDMFWFMVFVITVLSTLTLALYFYLRSLNIPLEELRSAMFVSISIDSLFMAFAFRSLTTPIWKIPIMGNIFFLVSFFISVALFGLVLTVPVFQTVLSYTPLPSFDLLLILGFSLASLATIEVSKWVFFERRK